MQTPWVGKSVWQGANGDKLSVEELSIEYYAKKGFKAVHSEGTYRLQVQFVWSTDEVCRPSCHIPLCAAVLGRSLLRGTRR